MTERLAPIHTAHLFAPLERALIELLQSLEADEWELPTIVPRWCVKDIAAHLLDTALRRLSLGRDGYFAETPLINGPSDLAAFINRLNHEGVNVYCRLSPPVLIELLNLAGQECAQHFAALDPFDQAAFGVSWAGETTSTNWFDTAREFTERWHHQQQIRLAVNQPGMLSREFYFPVLDTFMRALPFHYRDFNPVRAPQLNLQQPSESYLQFTVQGECGGDWYLCQTADNNWQLLTQPAGERLAHTIIPADCAWRLFTKGIDHQSAQALLTCTGDTAAGLHILHMLAIVA